jgi:hypothetical protein
MWWSINESKFPNVDFLAWRILGILNSQIKIKWNFLVVGVIISLWCCRVGLEKLDKLIIIYKNWLVDAQVDYKFIDGYKLMEFFFVVEKTLLEENEDLLEKTYYFEET